MYDVFRDPRVMQPVLILAVIAITILAMAGMWMFRRYKAEKLITDLKMDMLDRGMSAEEIERIIVAKPGGGKRL
jgi:hypothetical protein